MSLFENDFLRKYTACNSATMIISNVYSLEIISSSSGALSKSYISIENDDYDEDSRGLFVSYVV